jgi:hypothetical protein
MLVEKVLAGNFVGNDLGKDGSGQVRNRFSCASLAITSGGTTVQPSRSPGASVLETVLK